MTSERGDGVGLGKSPVNATARLSTGKVVELEDMVFVEVDESSVLNLHIYTLTTHKYRP